jgi:hypothetical protein
MQRELNLSRLNAEQRQKWWGKIQSDAPELAELLQNPTVVALKVKLGAQVIIKIDENGQIIDGQY